MSSGKVDGMLDAVYAKISHKRQWLVGMATKPQTGLVCDGGWEEGREELREREGGRKRQGGKRGREGRKKGEGERTSKLGRRLNLKLTSRARSGRALTDHA